MKALALANGQVTYQDDYPRPQPGPDQALVRVLAAGICATDLEIIKGYAGFSGVLGHEFVGVVEAAADPAWIGQRVVGDINIGCGHCPVCLDTGSEHCPNRIVLGIVERDGAFADYVALPLANLHAVPDAVPDEAAIFTEPLAAALRICQQVDGRPGLPTAVVGPGRLGMLVGQALTLHGAAVTMLGRTEASLALPARLGLATGLADDAPTAAFDLVVEATGNEVGLAQSLRLVRPLGRLVLKSTFAGQAAVDLSQIVVNEITVVGSRCGPFPPALSLLAEQRVAVAPLVDAEYPLREGVAALEHAARPGVRKVVLRP